MGRVSRRWLVGILGLPIAAYVGLCAYLFVEQRQLVFQPNPAPLDGPPAGSGLLALDVPVPGVGVLHDWWAPPASRAAPTIIFFHGNASTRADFVAQAAFFQRRGWGVVLASYPGFSGNPGHPTESTLMSAGRATIGAVAPRVGPIMLWGHSLGSGVAARMASEGRAAGLVLESAYTSTTDVAAELYPYVPVRLLMLDRFDTRSLLPRIQIPVLIFHSTDDPVIPFAMGSELAHRLGSRATFVRMTGLGHNPHNQDLSNTVAAWAQRRHIGG